MKRKYSQEEVWEKMSGRMYFSKEDSNIFIRRKGASSWTMNLGNGWSWVIMGVEVVMVLAIILRIL